MTSAPSNPGWHSRLSDDLTCYLSGASNPSPPIHSIPPEFVVLNWDDVALFDNPLPHHILQTSAPILEPGYTTPCDDQGLALHRDTEAMDDGLADFSAHGSPGTHSQLSSRSTVPDAPSFGVDPPIQVQTGGPLVAVSASNPRRRRAAPRSRAQENHLNKPQPVAGRFKCKWEGCTNTDGFSRKGELQRHINTIHLSPRSFECPIPGCGFAFNRKDNLSQHLQRVHEAN